LGDVRHRAEVAEYRVEQHVNILRTQLEELGQRFGTTAGTANPVGSVSRACQGPKSLNGGVVKLHPGVIGAARHKLD